MSIPTKAMLTKLRRLGDEDISYINFYFEATYPTALSSRRKNVLPALLCPAIGTTILRKNENSKFDPLRVMIVKSQLEK